MNSVTEALARLHALHTELEQVEEERASGPRRVEARQRAVAKKQEDRERQKARIIDLRKAADERSLQLKTNEARINELRGKLNTATSNREYDIIKTQIEADTVANSVLEDEILDALEKVDTATGQLSSLETEHGELVKQQEIVAQEVAGAEAGLVARADVLRGEIDQAEEVIPEKARVDYRRLVTAHGAGALASVEGMACTACYSQVSPQEGVQLNVGKIILCRSCGRLLYRAAE